MPYRRSCAACALAAVLLLSGCSAVTGSDVESLLRAPQASGERRAEAISGTGSLPPDKMAAVRSGMRALESM